MIRVFLGLTALLTLLLLPLGHVVAFMLVEAIQIPSRALLPVTKILLTVSVAGVFAWLTIARLGLSRRLPPEMPGANCMLIGAVLFPAVPAVLTVLVLLRIDSSLMTLVLSHGLFHMPALIFLVVGVSRLFLSAAPVAQPGGQPDLAHKAAQDRLP